MIESSRERSILYNRIIFVLSILGIVMAAYVLQSFLRQSSILCLTGNGCELVRKNPVSWPLGIPVPAFGLIGYTGLTILSFLRSCKLSTHDWQLTTKLMFGIAIFGICFVTWFTAMEIFVIKGICFWCVVSAAVMYGIFSLLVWESRTQNIHT